MDGRFLSGVAPFDVSMNKANNIRKKALDYAKKRQWDKALNEYIRLSEIEENNPNVFNELGDLHLKIGNKAEAFRAFHSAIDAYERLGLFNNAVAVCKKIIRLNSADRAVYGKLARLRNEQGFKKEAVTYAVSFLEKIAKDTMLNPDDVKSELTNLADHMDDSPEVLERVADYLVKWEYNDDAGKALEKLASAYASLGMDAEAQQSRDRMSGIGHAPPAPSQPADSAEASPTDEEAFETHRVETADTASATGHTAQRRPVSDQYHFDSVDLGSSSAESVTTATQTEEMDQPGGDEPRPAATESVPPPPTGSPPPPSTGEPAPRWRVKPPPQESPNAPPSQPAEQPPSPPSDPAEQAQPTASSPSPETVPPSGSEPPSPPPADDPVPPQSSGDPGAPPPTEAPTESPGPKKGGPSRAMSDDEVWVPSEELPDGLKSSDDGPGGVVQVSDIVGKFSAEVKADVDAEDYRSHYDLGMAYLEMDLIPEAIREFQFAATASMYQARSLELIGLCFIRQNQPRLAIKQLEKGLALVGDIDRDSIGLQYNLGLAYEMMGDVDKAKLCFEEVYVIDVTFRDVAEKMKKYSS
jgi:tetratricopeptide (TPR) repeat protein